MYRTRDLVDLAQKGIPEKYRVEIWMVYTGMSKVGKGVQSRCIQTNFNLEQNILHSASHTHSIYSNTYAGALDGMESHPGMYAELVDKSERVKCLAFEEIERDLHR